MSLLYVLRLFGNPRDGWIAIRDARMGTARCLFGHTIWLALIPAAAGFFGTTQVGWQVGVGDVVRLTVASAGRIAVLYYLAMIAAVFSVGWMVRWMSRTYGAEQPLSQCLALASYTATPLFLVGLMQAYPLLWLNLVVGLPALGYTVYVFYTGVPIVMEISEDRGFLFATAVMGFGLIALVAMLAVTVLLWGAGFAPAFHR